MSTYRDRMRLRLGRPFKKDDIDNLGDAPVKFFTKTDWSKSRPDRVIGYYVMFEDETGEHVFSHFAVNRKQSARVAWHLANTLRDDMNAGIE